jgi:hypothetical protein
MVPQPFVIPACGQYVGNYTAALPTTGGLFECYAGEVELHHRRVKPSGELGSVITKQESPQPKPRNRAERRRLASLGVL